MCHLRDDVAQPLGVDKVKVLELKSRVVKVQQNSCREKQPHEKPRELRRCRLTAVVDLLLQRSRQGKCFQSPFKRNNNNT